MSDFILHGNIIYSENKDKLIINEGGYAVCKDGISAGVYDSIPDEYKDLEVIECGDRLVVPGFTDLHVHAPQYGLGACSILQY